MDAKISNLSRVENPQRGVVVPQGGGTGAERKLRPEFILTNAGSSQTSTTVSTTTQEASLLAQLQNLVAALTSLVNQVGNGQQGATTEGGAQLTNPSPTQTDGGVDSNTTTPATQTPPIQTTGGQGNEQVTLPPAQGTGTAQQVFVQDPDTAVSNPAGPGKASFTIARDANGVVTYQVTGQSEGQRGTNPIRYNLRTVENAESNDISLQVSKQVQSAKGPEEFKSDLRFVDRLDGTQNVSFQGAYSGFDVDGKPTKIQASLSDTRLPKFPSEDELANWRILSDQVIRESVQDTSQTRGAVRSSTQQVRQLTYQGPGGETLDRAFIVPDPNKPNEGILTRETMNSTSNGNRAAVTRNYDAQGTVQGSDIRVTNAKNEQFNFKISNQGVLENASVTSGNTTANFMEGVPLGIPKVAKDTLQPQETAQTQDVMSQFRRPIPRSQGNTGRIMR